MYYLSIYAATAEQEMRNLVLLTERLSGSAYGYILSYNFVCIPTEKIEEPNVKLPI